MVAVTFRFGAAVVFVMEVTAVEAVSQSVPFATVSVMESASFVPAVSAVVPPAVSAAVVDVDVGTSEIKVITPRIM